MKSLSDALLAVDRDLEKVFVMEQRGFITMRLAGVALPPDGLEEYSRVVATFNAAFDEHRSFELLYTSSVEHKTRENALVLDAKYERLNETFKLLKPVILATKEYLRSKLEK
jgi:hypothetical protein